VQHAPNDGVSDVRDISLQERNTVCNNHAGFGVESFLLAHA
jgi:hypothetical protein